MYMSILSLLKHAIITQKSYELKPRAYKTNPRFVPLMVFVMVVICTWFVSGKKFESGKKSIVCVYSFLESFFLEPFFLESFFLVLVVVAVRAEPELTALSPPEEPE